MKTVITIILTQILLYIVGAFIMWDLQWFLEVPSMIAMDRAWLAYFWFSCTVLLQLFVESFYD